MQAIKRTTGQNNKESQPAERTAKSGSEMFLLAEAPRPALGPSQRGRAPKWARHEQRRRRNSCSLLGQLLILLVILQHQVGLATSHRRQIARRSTGELRGAARRQVSPQSDQSNSLITPHTVPKPMMYAREADSEPTGASSQQQAGHESFCQPQTVGLQQQLAGAESTAKKVFCFYDIQDDFRPQDLNPCLCTHVVYSYVAVRKNLSFIAGKKGE